MCMTFFFKFVNKKHAPNDTFIVCFFKQSNSFADVASWQKPHSKASFES